MTTAVHRLSPFRSVVSLAQVLVCGAGLVATAAPALAGPQEDVGAVIYDKVKFMGRNQFLPIGRYDAGQLKIGNDRLSSLNVPLGLRVTLFEHRGFSGRQLIVTSPMPAVPGDFNDITSSIVVEAVPQPIPPAPPNLRPEVGRPGVQAPPPAGQQPPVNPPPPQPVAKPSRDFPAGPLFNQEEANQRCPRVCAVHGRWNGQWRTTEPGRMSVCGCELRVAMAEPPPPAPPPPPPVPPPPMAMTDGDFGAFKQRVVDASFPKDQLAAVEDQVRVGSRFNTRQVMAIMEVVSFPEWQVKVATAMWPGVVDPQNLPAVIASLTFESHREQLRRALHTR